jgi:hypothetical protein
MKFSQNTTKKRKREQLREKFSTHPRKKYCRVIITSRTSGVLESLQQVVDLGWVVGEEQVEVRVGGYTYSYVRVHLQVTRWERKHQSVRAAVVESILEGGGWLSIMCSVFCDFLCSVTLLLAFVILYGVVWGCSAVLTCTSSSDGFLFSLLCDGVRRSASCFPWLISTLSKPAINCPCYYLSVWTQIAQHGSLFESAIVLANAACCYNILH